MTGKQPPERRIGPDTEWEDMLRSLPDFDTPTEPNFECVFGVIRNIVIAKDDPSTETKP